VLSVGGIISQSLRHGSHAVSRPVRRKRCLNELAVCCFDPCLLFFCWKLRFGAQVGARVITGTKRGTIRFIGPTEVRSDTQVSGCV
jgi:hypothetical protein